MAHLSKRNFLKKIALAGLAGAAFSPEVKAGISDTEEIQKRKLQTRVLGRTGLKVPVMSSGALPVENINLVREIFKSGIRHVDSALVYKEGKNDEMVGKMLKEFGRKKFIVASKVQNDFDYTAKKFLSDNIGREFETKLDRILSLMQTDYLDILYVHDARCREQALHPEIMAAAEKAKKAGKTRFIGISTHENIPEVVQAACEAGIYDVVLASYNFRSGEEVKKAFAMAVEHGMGTVAMKTLAGGYLDKERTKPVNMTAALKYVLQDPNVHTIIKGIYTFEDLKKIMEVASDIRMTGEEEKALEEAKQYAGLYCKGCTVCLPMCPKNLPIPDMMRAYMYTYGYGEPLRGKELVTKHGIEPSVCNDCEECTVRCAMGFSVKERIRDIARLRDVPDEFLA